MPFLDELVNFSLNPLVALLLAVITFLFPSFVNMILYMLYAPMFCSKVKQVGLLGFRYEKQNSGKWESRGYKPMIGFNAEIVYDLEKCKGFSSKQYKDKERNMLLVIGFTGLLIGAGVLTGCLFWSHSIGNEFLSSLIRIFGSSWFVFSLGFLLLPVFVLIKINNKNSLGSYFQEAVGMIRANMPFEQMNLKSVKELNFKKVTYAEQIMYFPIYFEYLDSCDKFDKMPEAVNEIESIFKPDPSTRAELFCVITLAYYYSYHCVNPVLATQYCQKAGDFLAKDTDSNGMRIKAFYELNCCRNLQKATEYAQKANEVIDKFSTGTEREYERKCLARLDEAIKQYQSQQPSGYGF